MEYLPSLCGGAGSIKARLKQLALEPASLEKVHDDVKQTDNPETRPALDLDAENVDLAGYKFNRVILRASNSAQARPAGGALVDDDNAGVRSVWRIHQLSAWAPHSRLQASGAWEQPAITAPPGKERFVNLNLRFETTDLGGLLVHFGRPDLLTGGVGSMSGAIRWQGSPADPNLETLAGHARLDVRNGHLTSVDPGAAKLIGLLSLQMLPRLGDLATKGLGFDYINASARVDKGVARISNLDVAGSIADVKALGQVALPTQTVKLEAVVLPKIDLGGAALIATAINPAVGLSSYVAQLLLSKPLSDMSRQVLSIEGNIEQTQIRQLQGDEARAASQRVMGAEEADSAVDSLWNWQPVTRPQSSQKKMP